MSDSQGARNSLISSTTFETFVDIHKHSVTFINKYYRRISIFLHNLYSLHFDFFRFSVEITTNIRKNKSNFCSKTGNVAEKVVKILCKNKYKFQKK